MDVESLLAQLKASANPDEAPQMAAYMKNQFEFLGVRAPVRQKITRTFFKAQGVQGIIDWDFIQRCWESPWRELQYAALDYLHFCKTRLSPADIPRLKVFIISRSWWDTIDNFDRIVGSIALRHPEVNDTLLAWSVDDNVWLRRVAIDHQLLRKEKTDTALLERILVNNLDQTEFFINKAIGWALRDYSKTNPAWVSAFLQKYRHRMAALSVREAGKYL